MPGYVESGDRPWIKTGKESNLLASGGQIPYQFGYATDKKNLYIFDAKIGRWTKLFDSQGGSFGSVNVEKDNRLVGTRPTLNFLTGSNTSLNVSDNASDNKINITISVPNASDTTAGAIKLTNHLGGTYDNPIVVDDTSNQKVRVSASGTLAGTRREINFVPGSSISIIASDNATNNRVDVTISATDVQDEKVKADPSDLISGYLSDKVDNTTIKVNTTNHTIYTEEDSSNQRVRVSNNGVLIGTRREINFIPGTDISITSSDDAINNRINITIDSTATATDEKVKADPSDPTAGYLSDKVDNTTIQVDTTNHTIYTVNDSSTQRVEVAKDNTLVGTRKQINFLTGTNQTLTVTNDSINNRVNVQIDIPDASNTTKGVIQLTNHLGGTASSPTVVDDTSNQKVRVSNNGTLTGVRREINLIPGTGISISSSDDATNNRINVTISSTVTATDEKVKADSSDPTAGYLSDKVDNTTIKVNTTNHKIYAENDSSTQRVEVAKDGALVGTRKRINFVTGTNQTLTVSDNSTNNRVDVKIDIPNASSTVNGVIRLTNHLGGTASSPTVIDDTSNQRVRVSKSGTLTGTRREINFIPGSGISITTSDDTTNNRVNVTIDATGATTDEKVKADSSDPTAGYLSDKVDNSTIKVNTTNHKIYTENDSSNQRVRVSNNGTLTGTRREINFIPGTGISITSSDDTANNRVNVTINATETTDEKVKADASDPTAGYLSSKVDNNTIMVNTTNHTIYVANDSSTQRIDVAKDGTIMGTRRRINFLTGYGTTLTVTDSISNNQVNVKIEVPDGSSVQNIVVQRDGSNVGTRNKINFLPGNGLMLYVTDDSVNGRVNVKYQIEPGTNSSIESFATGELKLKDDANAAAKYVYSVHDTDTTQRKWRPFPLVVSGGSVLLNATLNLTSTETIIDGGGSNPAFQLVLDAGRWLLLVHTEGHIRGSCGASSGSEQILFSIWKREGTTDSLIRNIRAVFSSLNPNTTQNFSLFGGFDAVLFVDLTYTGNSTDIRGNNVSGTVIFLKGRYTQSGGVTVNLAQAFSTCSLEASKIV